MFVYWDSYFTLLGLAVQGRWGLAAGMVDDMVHAIERIGHVPGYISAKTICRFPLPVPHSHGGDFRGLAVSGRRRVAARKPGSAGRTGSSPHS